MLPIIWHSLARRWVQSLATLTAVLIGVGIFFALYLLFCGVSLGLETGKQRLGADLLVVPGRTIVEPETLLFTGQPYNVYMDRAITERVASIPGVRRTTPQFFTQTLDETCCSLTGATRLIGFDQSSDWLVRSWVEQLPGGGLSPDQVLIGSEVKGFSGETATILKHPMRVAAVLEPTGTSLDYSVLLSIDAARGLASSIPYFDVFLGEAMNADGLVSAVLVEIAEDAGKADVVAAIERTGEVKVIQAAGVFQGIKRQMDLLFAIMLGGGLLAAASSIAQLFSRFFSLAWDRKGEWGLYRALGATRRDLKLLIVGEALVLTLGGTLAGLALGYLLNSALIDLLRKQRAMPFMEPSTPMVLFGIVAITGIVAILGLLAAWVPAVRSGKIEPSSAMALADID